MMSGSRGLFGMTGFAVCLYRRQFEPCVDSPHLAPQNVERISDGVECAVIENMEKTRTIRVMAEETNCAIAATMRRKSAQELSIEHCLLNVRPHLSRNCGRPT